jgi:glycosyltransferase involved in cell wall biosynthesis
MHLHAHFCGGAAAHAIVAARLANASVSFICHGHDVYSEPEDLALKLNAADFVIATCADMASDLRAMAPKANIVVSYCGIDPSRFHPRTVESNGRLLFVGRLVEQKGVDDILRALALMDGVARPALDIVGTGPQKAALESLAESLGLLDKYVRFLGPQPRSWFSENGPDYLALVSPFKTGPNGERDSGPMVIKEAMGLGLPVISSRYMGVKEMILPGMGLLIEPGNVPELARALDTARAWSTTERAAITAKALDRLRTTFTLEKQAQDLTNCIQSVQARIRKKKFSNDKL